MRVALDKISPYWQTLRPHQWLKNILVFVPMLSAHHFDIETVILSIGAFIAFCTTASAVYIFNDLTDLTHDRAHATKRLRPLANGRLTIINARILMFALLLGSFFFSLYFLPLSFISVMSLYLILAVSYTLVLKRILMLDILVLTCLYGIRLWAGGTATATPPSLWLMAFSFFFFLSLALVKRWAELHEACKNNQFSLPGRPYTTDDLPIVQSMATSAGYVSIVIMAFYISSPIVKNLYSSPETLWLICPLLVYWISRVFIKTQRGLMTEDPIQFAMHDRVSLIMGLCAILIVTGGIIL
jgi:4-hydroxybenzoate polyprenyltransferase